MTRGEQHRYLQRSKDRQENYKQTN